MLLTSFLNFALIDKVFSVIEMAYVKKDFDKILKGIKRSALLVKRYDWLKIKGSEKTKSGKKTATATQLAETAKPSAVEIVAIFSKPDHIDQAHWKEFVNGSGIDPELTALNVISLDNNSPHEYLLYSDKLDRRNDGRLIEYWRYRYDHLSNGGWWSNGIDPLTGEDILWGCFKSNTPRCDKNGKLVKYEHPPKVPTECFFLKVSPKIWELVARKAGIDLPDDYADGIDQPGYYGKFWQWVISSNITIVITEGVKKALALLTAGYVGIALPGITGAVKQLKDEDGNKIGKPYLIPELLPFTESVDGSKKRKIIFAFDSDSKRATIRNLNREIDKAGKLLSSRDCQVFVASWHNRLGKGIDDILVDFGVEKIDEIYRNVKSFNLWKTAQLKQLTYSSNIEINQKYLMEKSEDGILKPAFKLPSNWQLLWLKSHKGAGKSTLINYLISPLVSSGEKKILLITHRKQLGRMSCDSLGISFIDEKNSADNYFNLGLCIDSLHADSQAKFNPEHWKDAVVILDEIQQLIWHVLSSSTCKDKRVKILKTFKQLLNVVIRSGGKIIIADADLRDDGIDFITGLIEDNVNIFGVLNTYQREENDRWNVHNYPDKRPSRIFADLLEQLKDNKKILLCVSAQKASSTWGTMVLERVINKTLPHIRTVRIDSETVGDKNHPAYGILSKVNGKSVFEEVVKNYDLVLASPTIETGVSIDSYYFDAVFGIFQGVQTVDSVRQHLSRYRQPVDRYIWLRPTGLNESRVGNGCNFVKGLLSGEYAKDQVNVQKLQAMGFEESLEGNLENIFINHWAIHGAIINDGMSKYRSQILADLADEGHNIISVGNEKQEEGNSQVVDETKVEVYTEHREKVEAAEDIDDDTYQRLKKQANRTEQERHQYQKGYLARRYQVPVTANLVKKDDDKWGTKIKLHFLVLNPDSSLPRQEKNTWSSILKNGDGSRFIPDSNKSAMATKIHALLWAGLPKLLETSGLHEEHELAVSIGDKVRKNLDLLKTHLGVDFRETKKPQPSNMFICRKLLSLIKNELPQLGQVTINGKRVRVHGKPAASFETYVVTNKKGEQITKLALGPDGQPIPIPDGREEVFAAWKAKELLEIEKEQREVNKHLIAEQLAEVLKQEIRNQNYSGVVAAVQTVENLRVRTDRWGGLSAEEVDNNQKVEESVQIAIQNLSEADKQQLKALQPKWFTGERQILPTTQLKSEPQPQSKQQQLNYKKSQQAASNAQSDKVISKFWDKANQDETAEQEIIRKFRENPKNIMELGMLMYLGGKILKNKLDKLQEDGLLKITELTDLWGYESAYMRAKDYSY